MNKYFTRVICLFLSIAMIFVTSNHAKADAKEQIIEFPDTEATIKIVENEDSRVTVFTDPSEKSQMVLVFNKKEGILRNVSSGIELVVGKYEYLPPCRVFADQKEYEYEFCQLGQYKYIQRDTMLSEFVAMITVTISFISIMAAIVSISGFALAGAAATAVSRLTDAILDLISQSEPLRHYRLHMTFAEHCEELWESDPYYLGGGFWFLGYMPTPTFFNWYIY